MTFDFSSFQRVAVSALAALFTASVFISAAGSAGPLA